MGDREKERGRAGRRERRRRREMRRARGREEERVVQERVVAVVRELRCV